jgi:hypothetical protein
MNKYHPWVAARTVGEKTSCLGRRSTSTCGTMSSRRAVGATTRLTGDYEIGSKDASCRNRQSKAGCWVLGSGRWPDRTQRRESRIPCIHLASSPAPSSPPSDLHVQWMAGGLIARGWHSDELPKIACEMRLIEVTVCCRHLSEAVTTGCQMMRDRAHAL